MALSKVTPKPKLVSVGLSQRQWRTIQAKGKNNFFCELRMRILRRGREVQLEQIPQHLEVHEAQLRIQLRTEDLMMTSLKESFQETSEGERQVVVNAQKLAIALQCEISQQSAACAFWKTHNLCDDVTRPPSQTMRQLFKCC